VAQARFIPGARKAWSAQSVEITYWTGLPRNQLDLPLSVAFGPKE
jgi:hypothetical protein